MQSPGKRFGCVQLQCTDLDTTQESWAAQEAFIFGGFLTVTSTGVRAEWTQVKPC